MCECQAVCISIYLSVLQSASFDVLLQLQIIDFLYKRELLDKKVKGLMENVIELF